ncbi:MAG: thiolase domain-containing protein [Anaerolineae bacterium]|uniref:thiolase domain-containing protein n=1 Tax=Promineifilum sp. TaxID=2664178 RepID=UPI001E09E08C|nr:thiolase domain-containing protein [Anaerolineales bacterium]MCB8935399.1 thiolase domain-containing protein [Promineifilum sp.]MCO5181549.1 thiolase domain-containing protein [Promineifilum sp.]MCW5846494.1 thiolase domain-containing protein [Anaerolineae bacterium]
MTNVSIIGIGQTDVREHWDTSIRHLAWYAIEAAMDDAHHNQIDAIYVGNMLAGQLSNQNHLGALVADFAGLRGTEALTVEAADASGGAALRQAVLAVQSGLVQTALVVGVEKVTDESGATIPAALATALDADYEAIHGQTLSGAAGVMMRRYMHEYGVALADFAGFSVNAHANAAANPRAMYRNKLRPEAFVKAPMTADPVSLFDEAPTGDGAAAVLVTTSERAADMVARPVRILASALATDTVALHDRRDLLWLAAAERSARRAYEMAGLSPTDIDVAELHDSFTILAALSLEACGFAERGQGWQLARDGEIGRGGRIPISTFGGLKARGNPPGATGLYQIVEVAQQLRGTAGDCQVADVRVGLAQNLGGMAGTAVTHILQADS